MQMQIFDRFPEPVFLISPEGIIRYRNAAARQLEPDWAEDTPVPPALSLQPDGPGVFTCVLGGQSFQAACAPAEEGTILVLRPCGEVGEGGLDPGFLAAHLRQQIQPISLAAQLLAREVPEQEDRRRHLAVIQQNLFARTERYCIYRNAAIVL